MSKEVSVSVTTLLTTIIATITGGTLAIIFTMIQLNSNLAEKIDEKAKVEDLRQLESEVKQLRSNLGSIESNLTHILSQLNREIVPKLEGVKELELLPTILRKLGSLPTKTELDSLFAQTERIPSRNEMKLIIESIVQKNTEKIESIAASIPSKVEFNQLIKEIEKIPSRDEIKSMIELTTEKKMREIVEGTFSSQKLLNDDFIKYLIGSWVTETTFDNGSSGMELFRVGFDHRFPFVELEWMSVPETKKPYHGNGLLSKDVPTNQYIIYWFDVFENFSKSRGKLENGKIDFKFSDDIARNLTLNKIGKDKLNVAYTIGENIIVNLIMERQREMTIKAEK